jgi:hypothetical protein
MMLNHARQTIDGIFMEAAFIKNYTTAAVVTSQRQFLQKIRECIMATHFKLVVSARLERSEWNQFGSLVGNFNNQP